MADLKTKPTDASVTTFLDRIDDPARRADAQTFLDLMQRATGAPPRLWGDSIVGFGEYHYRYASGHEGNSCLTGFSPRKAEFSLYLSCAAADEPERAALLARLGKHRMGKACLYVKRASDIDLGTLEALVALTVRSLRAAYPEG